MQETGFSSNLLPLVSYPIFRRFMDFFVALYDFGPFNENLVFCTVQKTENFSYLTKNVRKIIKQEGEACNSAVFGNEIQKKRVNPLFLLRFFHDLSNYLKTRDAPNRVVTTSRNGFQDFKEIRVFPCAKAHRDRKFQNLKNMFPLAELSGNRGS